jgi:hypothetical protein
MTRCAVCTNNECMYVWSNYSLILISVLLCVGYTAHVRQAGTITDITSKISGVFSNFISEQDLEAFSEILLIFDGIRARRQVCIYVHK